MTMRPEAPPFEPPQPDAESTKTENPFAKMVKAAVCEAFGEQRDWITAELQRVIDAVGRVNLAPLELAQKATEGRVRGHGDRLDSLENRVMGLREEYRQFGTRLARLEADARARPTDPAPPPEAA